ncbi:hypothetical protein SAMN02745207_04145 [Clostridium grantii DSM 8605]|uniref:Uncharacterized protein n=1 Tax=Clostridium grantii DSM 8605 TaxID=1121316 RepID=A0A1M5Y2Z2_9CLOT|nr:hypothetical protein SAMN02745207_04145 [Clostridium grantii DSM 8605]
MFSVILFIFCVSYLFGLIPGKIGTPIIFTYTGCGLLFKGLNSKPKNKFSKKLSISFGILFIIITIFVVIPVYYL